jgi:hypothetical protein
MHCLLTDGDGFTSSTKAGYLGEARLRRSRRNSLDEHGERTRICRATQWHSNASCWKLEIGGLMQAYRRIGVAYSGTHCLPESVVPVGGQAFEKYASRDYDEFPEYLSTVVFAFAVNNSSSSQRPCSGPRVVEGSAAVSSSKSHDLLKGEVGRSLRRETRTEQCPPRLLALAARLVASRTCILLVDIAIA